MSDRIHRVIMFASAVLVGIAGITGISDVAGRDAVSWMALAAAALTIVGNSWRILFPHASDGSGA